jgi:AAHS family benzoate transporter-like MFS transporter
VGTTSTPPTTTARAAGWVAALCWTAVLLDGFDLVVAGTVLPALSRPEEWGLSPSGATFVITIGLVGMTIGALTIGALTDIVGRRKALIGAVTSFSLFTLRCAVAPDAGVFGLLRFLAVVGALGALAPVVTRVREDRPATI